MLTDLLEVLDTDAAALPYARRIEALVLLAQVRELVDSKEQLVLAELATGDVTEQQWTRDEVACALGIAPSTAAGRLHDARDLVELLPMTLDHLMTGSIGARHARILLELTRSRPDDVRAAVERRVLPRAFGRTAAEFRRSVRRALAALDERTEADRHEQAMAERRVTCRPAGDAMSEVWALLPADGAATLMSTLAALVADSAAGDDDRTGDQRRADALIALAEGPPGSDATLRRSGPAVHVTMALTTLMGMDDHAGELAGHGPIPAPMARRIAADPTGTWRRIVTDPFGRPVDASRTYRPPAALRALIVARDVTCRFPGCSRPARRAEIDHIRDWHDGGPTHADNLHGLCSRHHHLKHDGGWRVFRDADHVTVWRSPTGRRYEKPPDDSIADYRPSDPARLQRRRPPPDGGRPGQADRRSA